MLSDWAEASHNCTICITLVGNTKKKKKPLKKKTKQYKIKQKTQANKYKQRNQQKTAIKKQTF